MLTTAAHLSRSNLGGLTNPGIDAMAPARKSAVLLVPALPGACLALWTSMAIDASRLVAFGLVIAGCHPRDLFQCSQIVLGDVILVVVSTAGIVACVGTDQVEDIA